MLDTAEDRNEISFLTELWTSAEPLPHESPAERFIYFLRRGWENVVELPLSSFVAVVTVALVIFLLGGFVLLTRNIDSFLSSVGSSRGMTVYLKDESNQGKDLLAQIQSNPQVESAVYVSKAEALRNFKIDFGKRAGLLEGLEDENPLPPSIEVLLKEGAAESASVAAIVEQLKTNKVVDEVVFGAAWFEKVESLIAVFRAVAWALGIVILGAVLFFISNTFKLIIYARRDELSIMQLVGASETYVRTPFVIGGALQGLIGAIAAVVFLEIIFAVLVYQVGSIEMFGGMLQTAQPPGPLLLVGMIVGGVLLGAGGSLLALGRHLKV